MDARSSDGGRLVEGARAVVGSSRAFRWLVAVVAGLAVCLVAGTVAAERWAARIDEHAASIATGGAPSVVLLSEAGNRARLVERQVLLARAATKRADRDAEQKLSAQLEGVIERYRVFLAYPGERELYGVVEMRMHRFHDAAAAAVADDAFEPQGRDAHIARVTDAADDLYDAIGALVTLNSHEIEDESHVIEELRHRSTMLGNTLRGATFILALSGIALGIGGARRYVALVEERNRLAEARAAELEMFAGRVAHDLRNPLTAIQMTSGFAARREAGVEALREGHQRIERQSRRMNGIIEALLAFAQSGACPAPGARSEVPQIVQDVVGDARAALGDRDVEIVVDAAPATVACAPSVLAVIVANLVGNAVKYIGAGTGGVRRITVRAREEVRRVHFEVEDTGPGLPLGAETRIFRPFTRFADASTGGVGLGLATVKRLVEAHGGAVGVESHRGRGCRFWFDLPKP